MAKAKLEDKNKLKRRKDFTKVYKKGRSIGGRSVVLCYRKTTEPCFRVGFTVSKKVGKAVVRNKIRRRLKEIARLNRQMFAVNYDYVFVARRSIVNTPYKELEMEV
ncbi:MAG: ribonuclease P protein component, partial [Bacillota bacterium]|nr:ribonuclease P protein component [Bacillota bacterium]